MEDLKPLRVLTPYVLIMLVRVWEAGRSLLVVSTIRDTTMFGTHTLDHTVSILAVILQALSRKL